jgi:hypothetical protein
MTMAMPEDTNDLERTITFCLDRVRGTRGGASSLFAAGSGYTDVSPERLWAVLENVEAWPRWSPLHTAARWTEGGSLTVGARFEQELDLGFPVGRKTESVVLAFAESGSRVGWLGDNGRVRSCHLWTLGRADDGRTQVCNVEAFAGLPVMLIKPLVASRWRRQFQAAVEGLIAAAEATPAHEAT